MERLCPSLLKNTKLGFIFSKEKISFLSLANESKAFSLMFNFLDLSIYFIDSA